MTRFTMLLGLFLVLIASSFSAGGSGTEINPYIIQSCAELGSLTTANTNIYYELGNDIDCSGQSWTTLPNFYAKIDGKGYSISGLDSQFISNLQSNGRIENIDFIGATSNGFTNYNSIVVGRNYGHIQSINVINSTMEGEDQVGIMVGRNENGGRIYYSSVRNSFINTHTGTSDYVGGFIGYNIHGGIIYESYSDFTTSHTVRGYNFIGGFAGRNDGQIFDSYSKANVDGYSYVGGFVGYNYGASNAIGQIYDSYTVGSVTGVSTYHAFAGHYQTYSSSNGKIYNSYYDRQVSGDTSNFGATGLLTTEIKSVKPFNGYENWDFKVKWYQDDNVNDGHLSLRKVDNTPWSVPDMLGTGVQGDEWQVTMCEHLYEIDYDTNKLGGHFKLMNNISCADKPQRPIGGNFVGKFDGQGFTISDTYVALFENIYTGAEVINLNIEDAYFTYSVSQDGILARNNYGIVRNVFTNGVVANPNDYVGGLIGYNRAGGYIYESKSYADIIGSTTASDYVGGLVGLNQHGGYIYESMSHNNIIQGYNYIGGFIGRNDGLIYDSYTHTQDITGNVYVGGFAGWNYGSSSTTGQIHRAYSIGVPTGSGNVGGFVGVATTYSPSNGRIYESFWDITTSGTTTSSSMAIGKYTSDMKTIQTYSGSNTWDFDTVWYMDNVTGYPKLRELDNVFDTVTPMNGDGSSGNPFQITECRQIKDIQNSLTSNYILMNDVFCEDVEMHRIGTFAGTFEGNNKVISGTYVPLFEAINSNGVVRNLGIINHQNAEAYDYYGVLARYNDGGRISNVYVSGEISTISNNYIGGLVGRNNGGVIEDSESYVNIYANTASSNYIGGLVGYNQGNGYIWRSFTKGNTIEGYQYVGGLVGYHRKGYIYDSYSKDISVSAYQGAGGLIGYQYANYIDYTFTYTSYASGSVDASSNVYEGGIAGYHYRQSTSYGNILNSYYNTETTGLTIGAGNHNAGIGLTTAQMQSQGSFTGFDFTNVWFMDTVGNDGYPNHQSFTPLVVVPFDVFINYPLNQENITLNDSISDITLQYVHNSNSTNMICKQYIDGVLIDTRYNVGTAVQSITLNRWLKKSYLYEVQCFDGIITEIKQHTFNVNVDVDLLGPNPNQNPSGGGTVSATINISEIIDAINALNLTNIQPSEPTVVNSGETVVYHSYYTGEQYLNDKALKELNKLNLTSVEVVDPRTNETINTTGKKVIDVTEFVDTLTLQDGTMFSFLKPENFWNDVLMKPVIEPENLDVEKDSFFGFLLTYFNNLVLSLLVFSGTAYGLSGWQFGKKTERWKRFKTKSIYVLLAGGTVIFVIKIILMLLI